MKIEVKKVKQCYSTFKVVILIDGDPVCIVRSVSQANEILTRPDEIKDGKVRKIVKEKMFNECAKNPA